MIYFFLSWWRRYIRACLSIVDGFIALTFLERYTCTFYFLSVLYLLHHKLFLSAKLPAYIFRVPRFARAAPPHSLSRRFYLPPCSLTRSVTKAQLKALWGRGAGHKHKRAHRIPPGSCRAQSQRRLRSWHWWGNLTLANVAHLHSDIQSGLWRVVKILHARQWDGCCEFCRPVLCVCLCVFLFLFQGYFLHTKVRPVGWAIQHMFDTRLNIKMAEVNTK